MSRRRDRPYRGGRSKHWIKVKPKASGDAAGHGFVWLGESKRAASVEIRLIKHEDEGFSLIDPGASGNVRLGSTQMRSVGGSRSAVMQLSADVSASGSYFGGVGCWLVVPVVCWVVVPVVTPVVCWLVAPVVGWPGGWAEAPDLS